MEEKRRLRKFYLDILTNYPKDTRLKDTALIEKNLFQNATWIESEIIGITIAKYPEIETKGIIEQGWKDKKRIVVPKCNPADRKMEFYLFEDYSQLETVYYGLLEPNPSKTERIDKDLIDLLIVPGLAFTSTGYRLGFGGGYYDRFLSTYKGHSVALSFSSQVIEELPIEGYDLPVQQLITEKNVYKR